MITRIQVFTKLNGNYKVKVTFNNNENNNEFFPDVRAASRQAAADLILSCYADEPVDMSAVFGAVSKDDHFYGDQVIV